MSRDALLAELQSSWDLEDQLDPQAPAGPRHSDRTFDLTSAGCTHEIDRGRVQYAMWRLLRPRRTAAR
jgi:hypothetical protein